MGWDPTVKLLDGGHYHIDVNNTTYKTLGVLQDSGTVILLSRGARVFKVQKAGDSENKTYVLKDLWLENDRSSERQIYDNILRDVGQQFSQEDVQFVRRHLLTPVESAFVEVDGVEDNTETSMMRSRTLTSAEAVRLPTRNPSYDPARTGKTHSSPSDMEVDIDHGIRRVREPEKIRHRRHYRIVFEEFAMPMHKVTTMKDVFTILVDLIEG